MGFANTLVGMEHKSSSKGKLKGYLVERVKEVVKQRKLDDAGLKAEKLRQQLDPSYLNKIALTTNSVTNASSETRFQGTGASSP